MSRDDPEPATVALSVTLRQDAPIPLDLDFTCAAGQIVALFGPSGSGKTTTLRCIAGLYRPATGRVHCGGETWLDTASGADIPAHRRAVGYVFQDYALFPHLTALGNVATALHHLPRARRPERARELLGMVHLDGLESRRPAALSGGQRQRVAVARALARDPNVLLLDEPFSAVDRHVRQALYVELEELRRRIAVPVILVTHDFEEVSRLAGTMVVLDRGKAVARGRVTDLTSSPDTPHLAHYVEQGSVLDALVALHEPDRALTTLSFAGGKLLTPLLPQAVGSQVRVRIPAREVILAGKRPDAISVHNILDGRVKRLDIRPDRPLVTVQIAVGEALLLASVTRDAVARLALGPGAAVVVLVKSVAVELPGFRYGLPDGRLTG